jgi:hypothetical protein
MARHNEVPIASIPEVDALEQVKSRMKQFVDSNAQLFEWWNELVEEYNDKLQAADKAVRARGVSCGDWSVGSYQTKYDWDYMYERYGRDEFLERGGKLETQQVKSGDKKRVDLQIDSGKMDPEDAGHIRKKTPKFSGPKPVTGVPEL